MQQILIRAYSEGTPKLECQTPQGEKNSKKVRGLCHFCSFLSVPLSRLEAVATRLDAIATRLEAIAIRLEPLGGHGNHSTRLITCAKCCRYAARTEATSGRTWTQRIVVRPTKGTKQTMCSLSLIDVLRYRIQYIYRLEVDPLAFACSSLHHLLAQYTQAKTHEWLRTGTIGRHRTPHSGCQTHATNHQTPQTTIRSKQNE